MFPHSIFLRPCSSSTHAPPHLVWRNPAEVQNAWDKSEKAQLEDLTWRKYLGAVPLISFLGTVMLDGQAKDLDPG
jgi:hypothetical protein